MVLSATEEIRLFESQLSGAAAAVEIRLAELLRDDAAPGQPQRLAEAMRHGTLGGGKRFRAFLVLETAQLFGAGNQPAALDVAAALECVHAYSLIHDDLPAMDNDELRRGRPTVWKAYDEWTAILAGDGLLTFAFEIIADAPHLAADRKLQLLRALARDAGRVGMVGGQALDLAAEKRGEPIAPKLAHIERMQAMKTGALIRFATEAGGIIGGASAEQQAALTQFGTQLGLAFQISDDLLDAEGDARVVGKAVGKDAGLGKATLVSLMGATSARDRLDGVVSTAITALASFGSKAAALSGAAAYMRIRDK